MELDEYASKTCASMHKAGNRFAIYGIVIGAVCIAVAIAGAVGVILVTQRMDMTTLGGEVIRRVVPPSFFGIMVGPAERKVLIFASLLQTAIMASVGLAIIAFGQWLKWWQIGRAKMLDAQTRNLHAMAKQLQQP